MFDLLIVPTTLPKLLLGIAQVKIVTDHEEPLDEDEDYSKRKHTPRMPWIALLENHAVNGGEDHLKLEMLVGHLLVDGWYL